MLSNLTRSELQQKFKALGLTGANKKSSELIIEIEQALKSTTHASSQELNEFLAESPEQDRLDAADQGEKIVFEPAARKDDKVLNESEEERQINVASRCRIV